MTCYSCSDRLSYFPASHVSAHQVGVTSEVTFDANVLTLAGVATRWLAHVPAERGAEGARRAVANAFGDFGDSQVVAAEQILCDGHAPGEQVFHWRQAHGAREALEERRARKRGRPRELGHRPRARDIAVHLLHRCCESRIGQPAQQPRRRIVTRRRPQRLDEQHLHEPREHEVAA